MGKSPKTTNTERGLKISRERWFCLSSERAFEARDGQQFLEVADPTSDSRFHRAQGDAESGCNLIVRTVLEIEERNRGAKGFVQLCQRAQNRVGIEVGFLVRGERRQLRVDTA